MPPIRQYLRVKRISFRDIFLLRRVDLADGERFRLEDVVAACKGCRMVSKRGHWMQHENSCPYCGCRETIPFQGKRDLIAGAQTPVVYSRGRGLPLKDKRLWIAGAAVLAVVLCIALWPRGSGKAGFFSDGNRFCYQDAAGQRYMNGAYEIKGKTYHFSDGYLVGESVFEFGGRTVITDEAGLIRTGWQVLDGKFVYADEKGVVKGRTPDVKEAGFYELEGLGTVYVGQNALPRSGWIVYDGGLYHLENGKGSPVADLDGEFDAYGRYFPAKAGFVDVGNGSYFLDEKGALGRGLIAHEGFVYALDASGMLRRYVEEWDRENIAAAKNGAMIPYQDRMVECSGGSVIVQGRTGMLLKGWILYDGAVYFADEEGRLVCGAKNAQPEGAFDGNGRFLPARAGRLELGAFSCYLLADGSLATGAMLEGNGLYLFDENGKTRANEQIADIGVTDGLGRLRPYLAGMYEIEGQHYCLSAQGEVLTGWQRCGKMYYFDPRTGRRMGAGTLIDGTAYALSKDDYFAPAAEGVYRLGEASYYVLSDGSLATGWRAVDGALSYFDEQTGQLTAQPQQQLQRGWISKSGARFYVQENGEVCRGWQLIDNKIYYFDLQTGAALTGGRQIEGKTYVFREDGRLQPDGPLALMVQGESIRIGKNGSPEGGLLFSGGHLYYYDQKTARLSASLPQDIPGWLSAMGGYIIPETEGPFATSQGDYYLDASGNVLTGWFIWEGSLFYADPRTGLLPKDGPSDQYPGRFLAGAFIPDADGSFQAEGRSYLFVNGRLVHGWVKLDQGVGYADPSTGQLIRSRTENIEGVPCQFDHQGRYLPSRQTLISLQGTHYLLLADGSFPAAAGVYSIDGRLTAVLAGGRVADSARDAGLDEARLSIRDGMILPVGPGMVNIGGDTYLLDETGAYATGIASYERKLYLFDGITGKMRKGVQGFSETGEYIPFESGVINLGTAVYYFLDTFGTLGQGMIETPEGDVYYADEEGKLASAFVTQGGDKYYFMGASGQFRMVRNDFISTDDGTGKTCFFYAGDDGKIVTGWQRINGSLHYFDEEGRMLFDTIQDGVYINQYGEVI